MGMPSHMQSLRAVSIPGERATLSAAETAAAARSVGLRAHEAGSVAAALDGIAAEDATARVLLSAWVLEPYLDHDTMDLMFASLGAQQVGSPHRRR